LDHALSQSRPTEWLPADHDVFDKELVDDGRVSSVESFLDPPPDNGLVLLEGRGWCALRGLRRERGPGAAQTEEERQSE
jgi:hypothetical protein